MYFVIAFLILFSTLAWILSKDKDLIDKLSDLYDKFIEKINKLLEFFGIKKKNLCRALFF
jgi:hypothetical protein